MNTTPVTLIQQAQDPRNAAAWRRLLAYLEPLMVHWTRRLSLREPDALDLAQETLVDVFLQLRAFDPGRSFRGWVWTILKHRTQDFRRRLNRERAVPLDQSIDPARDDVPEMDQDEFNQRLVAAVLDVARTEFSEATWKSFEEYVLKNRPAEEVARELGLSSASVYAAKSKVLKRLRESTQGLLDPA